MKQLGLNSGGRENGLLYWVAEMESFKQGQTEIL